MHHPNEKLEHYLALAASASGAGAADLCVRATADAGLHVFAELLAVPSVAALAADRATAPAHALLRLFAFGTYADWAADRARFPPLSDAHVAKLRTLSLVSLAAGHASLPYETLLPALGLSAARELEQFVLDALASGLVSARLDQRTQRVLILSVGARDVDVDPASGDIARMRNTLLAWKVSSDRVLASIDERIAHVNAESKRAKEGVLAHEEEQQRVIKSVRAAESLRNNRPDMWSRNELKSLDIDDDSLAHGDVGVRFKEGGLPRGVAFTYQGDDDDVAPMSTDADVVELMTTEADPRLSAPTGFDREKMQGASRSARSTRSTRSSRVKPSERK